MIFSPCSNLFCFVMINSMLVLPALCDCDVPPPPSGPGFKYSRATYYGSPDCLGTPSGACGYGEYGRTINVGNVGGVSRLYKGGAGCGACYQVRCINPHLCTDDGLKVMATDYGEGDHTDFILTKHAYSSMARTNQLAPELIAYGVVEIEYRRIPCLQNTDLKLKVHENSNPNYLALVVLYQGAGLDDVTALEICQGDSKQWMGMRRAYGVVFDIANPPSGDLSLRMQLTASDTGVQKLVQLDRGIPSAWKPGVTYVFHVSF